MRLTDARDEAVLLDRLTTFLRQRVRDQVGAVHGGVEGRLVELRTLRQLQLGLAEARTHPERRGSVIARFRRLALAHHRHPDFDPDWRIGSPDGVVSDALELLVRREGVDLATATTLLTGLAEEHGTDLAEVASQVVTLGAAAHPGPAAAVDQDLRPA